MPSIPDDERSSGPIPRRTQFTVSRSTWWRPRSTFGRILLGSATCLVLAAMVATGVVTRRFLTRDPHFRILGASSIQSSGLSEVNRTDVLPVFGEDIGRNIFFVPLSERRKQLEAIPWVQHATVMRLLPDRINISIVERVPVAFVRQGSQVELADADGVILSMPPTMMAQHHYSFPVVTGISAQDSLATRRTRMAVYQHFVAELDQNNQHLTEQVSEIDLSDPEDLRATMPEQGSDILAHFGEDQFLHRLEVYKQHIAEWRQRYPRLIGVDLRYPGEVPLEIANSSAGSEATVVSESSEAANAAPAPPKVVKPAATKPAAPKPTQTATATPNTAKAVPAAKALPVKTNTAAHKPANAKDKAAKLKAAKAKTAHKKAVPHKTKTPAHPVPAAAKQGA